MWESISIDKYHHRIQGHSIQPQHQHSQVSQSTPGGLQWYLTDGPNKSDPPNNTEDNLLNSFMRGMTS